MPSPFVTQHPTNFTLPLPIADLRSAEEVRLDLDVSLALRIADPQRFDVQFAPLDGDLTKARLAELLAETARTGLAPLFRSLPLAELDANPKLRGWLGTAVEHALRDEADLAGRSGLELLGVDAYDLRCQVLDQVRNTHETLYLRASLAQADAVGDKRLLDEMAAHVPVLEALLARKERLAELVEAENQVDQRLVTARRASQQKLHDWLATLRNPPSTLRPELWRQDLKTPVSTAPLLHDERVYVAARSGQVYAFDAATGEPAWPRPAELDVRPGAGMALAGGCLCIPAYDGRLYRLDPATGAPLPAVEVGGALSSAPTVDGQRLLLSADVQGLAQRPGFGQVALVDPVRGAVLQAWPVTSNAGLHASPTPDGERLYLGDRKGQLYALSRASGRVDSLLKLRSMVLGAVLLDSRRRQVVVGDGYGFVTAVTPAGRQVWQGRVGGAVVGQPLLTEQGLFVGAGDGGLHLLDPGSGKAVRDPFVTGGPIATSPLACQGLVVFGSRDGYLYAVDAASGKLFWKYHSGSPVLLPPALAADGRLFVVDEAGRLGALRWCLSQYAEGARRLQGAPAPLWRQVVELWALAGEAEEAIKAAQQGQHLDLAAELALSLNWHRRAAGFFQQLARLPGDPRRAARWWQEAAHAWTLEGNREQAEACLLRDAQARQAPLLALRPANAPLLVEGEAGELQVEVHNLGPALALDVILAYSGHVPKADQVALGAIGAQDSRWVTLHVVPTQSGSATVTVAAYYSDGRGVRQRPTTETIPLRVGRRPEIHQHYYGPHVGGDGVIILRGGAGGERQVRVQSGEDAVTLARKP